MDDVAVVAGSSRCRLYEVLRRGRHALLCSGALGLDLNALRAYGDVLDTVSADQASARRSRPAVWLVRPDGYIAAGGAPDQIPAVLDYLEALFARYGKPGQVTP